MRKNTMRNISNEDKIKNFYFLSPGLPLPISVITREPHKLSSKHVIVFRPEELPDDGGLAHAGAAQEHHGVFSHLTTRPRICRQPQYRCGQLYFALTDEQRRLQTVLHLCPHVSLVDDFCPSGHKPPCYLHLLEGSRQTRLSPRGDDLIIEMSFWPR